MREPANLPPRPMLLAVAALGVVYGDIGTSPLYALRECFQGPYGITPTETNILGVLSLVFWSLTGVVSVKYLTFIMRADNRGEGGIFSLLGLIRPVTELSPRVKASVVLLALFGAALLYGDGVITPAISVLSAVEGLSVATAAARPVVVPLTVVILVLLFLVQQRGTARIGGIFGPIMLVWFVAIAALGLAYIARNPSVLAAASPLHAARFLAEHHLQGFFVLGAVVLVITGGEALYADMGHFGRRPIKLGWFSVVFPALLLNYFGQGALLLEHPELSSNPFYALVPRPLLYPMVALATIATVIASQALISGAFSLTRQAVQLGYWPRVTIVHTSAATEGQIYIPEVNRGLMVACIGLVLAFHESSRLAAAYGIAVTGTMAITSVVYYFVLRHTLRWSFWPAASLVGAFLILDLGFFGSSLLKFVSGGWVPLAIAGGLFVLMTTWRDGRTELAKRLAGSGLPVDLLLEDVARRNPRRVAGTAVFMSSDPRGVPTALLHHLKHNQVLHQQVVLLSILSLDVPKVPATDGVTLEDLGLGVFRVIARYGFMETPSVPDVLHQCRPLGLATDLGSTSFYLSRETLLTGGRAKISRWRKALFAFLARNARPATAYFRLPPGRVVELGIQIEL